MKLFLTLILALSIMTISIEQIIAQKDYPVKPVPFNEVDIQDEFWKPRLKIQADTLVPFALDKTKPAVENLQKAANYLKGIKDELPFPHRYISSDLYKVMEGAAYILRTNPDEELEKQLDGIIDIIADAQRDDGYLYVAHITGVAQPKHFWGGGGMGDKPYSWVVHSHELYNIGHMIEAAVAYYQSTGKDKWLKVAEKSANHINKVFFIGDPDYNDGKPVMQAPGHEELELALAKLYRVTGKELYLEMAKKFLEIRGVTFAPEGDGVMSPTYAQQHKPVKEQKEAVGHAVRAAYMYSAMADVDALLSTDEFATALNSIWHNIADTKMHITGGLGAVRGIEGFGESFELPNKEAYDETCAAVGNVLFNFRMFLKTKEAKYFDVAEVALFNNVLAGVNLKGNKFFYVNPLEAESDTKFNYGQTGRSPWFNTACCPSNLARLLPQVPGMMYSYTGHEIYITLYGSSETVINIDETNVKIKQSSQYPFDENVLINIDPVEEKEFVLKLRIPTWAQGEQFLPGMLYDYHNTFEPSYKVTVNGKLIDTITEDGFVSINRKWSEGDKVELFLPMPVKFNSTIDSVKNNIGRIAVTRGPLVYCAEGIDNGDPVQDLVINELPGDDTIIINKISDGILNGIPMIEFPGRNNSTESIQLKLIPYYSWNNRGSSSMIVWLPFLGG
ncbi:MAG: glycoside hydrolase family 127 protein [Melioribacteraceae bacterium]|nr:glycoside hydrolase family 127 protein [Melioribacteraceae bacterium]MCF8355178.1 glycoside hydrolase family 127 protein [Melioribacteraceae bacterium]MCF8395391.1 glycoside hydrolase family 127 protein [Melioribacteraceae bacterium]MCF8419903.1 glycoside hydrolase family 127 protein [Melioribacteraceae bacterium]